MKNTAIVILIFVLLIGVASYLAYLLGRNDFAYEIQQREWTEYAKENIKVTFKELSYDETKELPYVVTFKYKVKKGSELSKQRKVIAGHYNSSTDSWDLEEFSSYKGNKRDFDLVFIPYKEPIGEFSVYVEDKDKVDYVKKEVVSNASWQYIVNEPELKKVSFQELYGLDYLFHEK